MIGIIGAMDSEVSYICNQMENKESCEINHLTFYKGKLFGKDVVLVKSGIGKVNAALCAQLLILKFNVDKVVNTGVAGATGEGLEIYDFVVSTEAVYHDFDIRFFGYKLGQIPGLPERFSADKALIDCAVSAFEKTDLPKNHKMVKGLVASGDQFIGSGDVKNNIVSNFHPMCVEMEGAAIAHACHLMNVPFVIVRCMSDTADDSVETTYSEDEAAAASCKFLVEMIKNS